VKSKKSQERIEQLARDACGRRCKMRSRTPPPHPWDRTKQRALTNSNLTVPNDSRQRSTDRWAEIPFAADGREDVLLPSTWRPLSQWSPVDVLDEAAAGLECRGVVAAALWTGKGRRYPERNIDVLAPPLVGGQVGPTFRIVLESRRAGLRKPRVA